MHARRGRIIIKVSFMKVCRGRTRSIRGAGEETEVAVAGG